ncbi:MAG: hypothetical protein M1813_008867 [Trichoglossum hirsutum]|jgi:hypothetical protein|nr:MAG: hypothetical protein M1813_008867 [Trichoglossum hirsutum]
MTNQPSPPYKEEKKDETCSLVLAGYIERGSHITSHARHVRRPFPARFSLPSKLHITNESPPPPSRAQHEKQSVEEAVTSPDNQKIKRKTDADMDNMDMEYSYDNSFSSRAGADGKGKQKAADQEGFGDQQKTFYSGRENTVFFNNTNAYPLSPPESEPDYPLSPSTQPLNLRQNVWPVKSAPFTNSDSTTWPASPSPFALGAATTTTNITYPLSPPASDYGTPAPTKAPSIPPVAADTTFQILVRDLSGRTVTVDDAKSTTTVRELKRKFSEKADVPISELRFIFLGKEMSDGEWHFLYLLVAGDT